jgi:hypothetical protein
MAFGARKARVGAQSADSTVQQRLFQRSEIDKAAASRRHGGPPATGGPERERTEDQEVEDATLRCCCCCSFELFFFLFWLMYWGTGFVHTPTPFIQVKLYKHKELFYQKELEIQ